MSDTIDVSSSVYPSSSVLMSLKNVEPTFEHHLAMTKGTSEGLGKINPAGIYLLKVNNRKTGTRYEICSKLTIKISEQRHWRRSGFWYLYC